MLHLNLPEKQEYKYDTENDFQCVFQESFFLIVLHGFILLFHLQGCYLDSYNNYHAKAQNRKGNAKENKCKLLTFLIQKPFNRFQYS